MKLAFIGLGVMGYPMAGHLAKAGHDVTVYNRNAEKAKRWVGEYGGASAPTPAEAAANMDAVLACVGRDEDLREFQVAAFRGTMQRGGPVTVLGRRVGAVFDEGPCEIYVTAIRCTM